MAKKVLKPFKKLAGGIIGGKKKAKADSAEEQKGPIITQLGGGQPENGLDRLRRRIRGSKGVGQAVSTILGGDRSTLGG